VALLDVPEDLDVLYIHKHQLLEHCHVVLQVSSKQDMYIHCVTKKVHHITFYNIFNNSRPILVTFGTIISE